MANIQDYADTLQTEPFHASGYLGTWDYTVVFSRAYSVANASYPVTYLRYYDHYSGVGAYTDVMPDMLIRVMAQNTSVVKGYLRVAAGGADSDKIQVEEFSLGTLDLRTDDRIDVIDYYAPKTKLLSATQAFKPDSRINYTDQHNNYYPFPNGGGDWFGFVDDGQTYATVQRDWRTSFCTDPDSTGFNVPGTGLDFLIDVGDGTITVGSTTTSTCTIRFPVGQRHIKLTVTDQDNGKSSVKWIKVKVYDRGANAPLSVAATELRYDGDTSLFSQKGNYWSTSFALPIGQESAVDTLPDQAYVCYFKDEYYGGTRLSFGSDAPAPGSDHIKFIGYLQRETVEVDPDNATVTFEAVGLLGVMENIGSLSALALRDSTPNSWQEYKQLNTMLLLLDILYWRSSILSSSDVRVVDGRELAYGQLGLAQSNSLADQFRDLATALQTTLTCTRLNCLLFIRNPRGMSLADRLLRDTSYAPTVNDILSVKLPREHWRTVKTLRAEGIKQHTTVLTDATLNQYALFADAPGVAPGEGAASETVSKIIAVDQTDLNRIAGELYADRNNLYWDEDNTKAIEIVPRGVELSMPMGYDVVDPALMQYFPLVLPTSRSPRNIGYTSGRRWLLGRVVISYDLDTGEEEITWTVDHETHGPPGTPYYPPTSDSSTLPIDVFNPGLGELSTPPPVANFSSTPTTGTAPLLVDFTNLSSGPISSYAWDFDDSSTSTDTNPSHSFAAAGTYNVSLTATGPTGLTSTATAPTVVDATITVLSAPIPSRRMACFRGTKLCTTTNFSPTSAWAAAEMSLGGKFWADKSSAGWGLETGQVDGWLLNSANLYRLVDTYGTPVLSFLKAFPVVPKSFAVSPNGVHMMATWIDDIRNYTMTDGTAAGGYSSFRSTYLVTVATTSDDGGGTWSTPTAIGDNYPANVGGNPGAYVTDAGVAYTSYYGAGASVDAFRSGRYSYIRVASSSNGTTWDSDIGRGATQLVGQIHLKGTYLFVGNRIASSEPGFPNILARSDSTTTINASPYETTGLGSYPFGPQFGSGTYGTGGTSRAMDDDGSMLFLIGEADYYLHWGLFKSANNGASWTTIDGPNSTAPALVVAADPANAGCCFMDTGSSIYYYDGATLADYTGDLATIGGGSGEGLAI